MSIQQRVERVMRELEQAEALLGISNVQQVELELVPGLAAVEEVSDAPEEVNDQPEGGEVARILTAVTDSLLEADKAGLDLSQITPLVVTSVEQLRDLPSEVRREALEQARQLTAILEEVA